MSKPCPYCSQANTHKDEYGYCKVHSCFLVSGDESSYKQLREDMKNAKLLPVMRYNQFDNRYYPKRKPEVAWVIMKIEKLLGYVPLECL